MINNKMTSLERVFTAIAQKEPDRVPLFLMLTMHGAKELGISIKDYFSKSENVVKGQMILREKYNNDCIYSLFYAPIEVEAWGGEVLFADDGPPNSGEPFIKNIEQIKNLQIPDVENTSCLLKVLNTIEALKKNVGDGIPIIGVVVSPYSVPVMQMGFDKYLELMYFRPKQFNLLMKKNMAFAVSWANAQIKAGATAICFFDPLASPTIIEKEQYKETGFKIAKDTIAKIKGPIATHLASGKAIPILNELVDTGTMVAGISVLDNICRAKKVADKRITLLGNLDGLEMRNWHPGVAEKRVKEAIRQGASGGGFILSDNHGEIPWQVSDDVLLEIAEAVKIWGNYPLDWIEEYE